MDTFCAHSCRRIECARQYQRSLSSFMRPIPANVGPMGRRTLNEDSSGKIHCIAISTTWIGALPKRATASLLFQSCVSYSAFSMIRLLAFHIKLAQLAEVQLLSLNPIRVGATAADQTPSSSQRLLLSLISFLIVIGTTVRA